MEMRMGKLDTLHMRMHTRICAHSQDARYVWFLVHFHLGISISVRYRYWSSKSKDGGLLVFFGASRNNRHQTMVDNRAWPCWYRFWPITRTNHNHQHQPAACQLRSLVFGYVNVNVRCVGLFPVSCSCFLFPRSRSSARANQPYFSFRFFLEIILVWTLAFLYLVRRLEFGYCMWGAWCCMFHENERGSLFLS